MATAPHSPAAFFSGNNLTRTPSSLLRSPASRSTYTALPVVADDEGETKKLQRRPAAAPDSTLLAAAGVAFTAVVLLVFLYPFLHPMASFGALGAASFAIYVLWRGRCPAARSSSVQWFIGDGERKVKKGIGRLMREGIVLYPNGGRYEGEFHKGICNGSGSFFGAEGKYEGEWINGKYDGHGVETLVNGSRYRGQYRNGLFQGLGVYRFYMGDSYSGEWSGGQTHGVGVLSCSDGSSYSGQFKYSRRHGLGCYSFRNGDRYAGEYFGDTIHGYGIYRFSNGHCYEGSWHEGKRTGFGSYTFLNGDTESGEWDSGSLKSCLHISDPNVQLAVQAARKAAVDATNLPGVDEQLNQAIMAASRAATAARVAAIKAAENGTHADIC